jgi:hypothetical protein
MYLTGSGHFAIGFSLGFLLMIHLTKRYDQKINVQLYAPFIPFILGIFVSFPYLFLSSNNMDTAWLNIFIFFNFLHHNDIAIMIFGRLYLVTIICGSMYVYILLRYIALIKYCRRYKWNEGSNNA